MSHTKCVQYAIEVDDFKDSKTVVISMTTDSDGDTRNGFCHSQELTPEAARELAANLEAAADAVEGD